MAPFCLRGHFRGNRRSKLQVKDRRMKGAMRRMQKRLERLKTQMEEISEEQKIVREGQRRVKENFEAIESECAGLKRETRLIIQQSARNQIKLALMFRILKAREQGDLATAAALTQLLREIVVREHEEKEASDDY